VSVALVAPAMGVPSLLHWYDSGSVPVAATEKVTVSPSVTDASAGWAVIDGGRTGAFTVIVTAAETPSAPR